MSAVAVSGLTKAYGGQDALRGISFEIEEGEVFGLLGPNGAGKTTTVEILEGYRRRDSGEVSVLGVDPADADGGWRDRIGIVLQSSAMYPRLTVFEHMRLFAGYYATPRDPDEVITLVGLAGEARRAREVAVGRAAAEARSRARSRSATPSSSSSTSRRRASTLQPGEPRGR